MGGRRARGKRKGRRRRERGKKRRKEMRERGGRRRREGGRGGKGIRRRMMGRPSPLREHPCFLLSLLLLSQ